MLHDPLCERPNGPNFAMCYCDLIARVREDEKRTLPPTERHREWWVAFGMGKLAGHKDGYAAALRDAKAAVEAAVTHRGGYHSAGEFSDCAVAAIDALGDES